MGKEEIDTSTSALHSPFCRICVTTSNVSYDIYETKLEDNEQISLHAKLNGLFPTIFNDEQATSEQAINWPSKVCSECMRQVTEAYGLHELCLKSTDRLKKLLCEDSSAAQTETDVIKVEQIYLSVKAEFRESDCEPEQSTQSPECRKRTFSNRQASSPSRRNTKSTKDSFANEKGQKKQKLRTRGRPARHNGLPEINTAEGSPGGSSTCKDYKSEAEGSSVTDALETARARKPRVAVRQPKEPKTSSPTTTQDCTENESDKAGEPESKIDLYRCQLCDGPTYTSPTDLTEHLKATHPDQIRSCELCPKVFMNESTFQHHQYCHATMRSHFCTFCDKGFQTAELLKSHIRMHTHRGEYLCSLCGKEFNNKSNLRQHLKRHTGDKPWACSQCPGRFTTKGGLTSHQHTHTKVKAFSCDTCGSQFNKHYSLIKHQLIHTGTRPYSCEVCAMRFTSSYHVKRHMRTHTGEKPYKCTYCERSFAQSNDMVKHMRMHVGDNPYQCDRCDASFRLLADLRNHYQEHYQPGEKALEASSADDEAGIRFTSTDILKLRYRKEMAQSNLDCNDGNAVVVIGK